MEQYPYGKDAELTPQKYPYGKDDELTLPLGTKEEDAHDHDDLEKDIQQSALQQMMGGMTPAGMRTTANSDVWYKPPTTAVLTEEKKIEMALLNSIKAGDPKAIDKLLEDATPAQLSVRNPEGETTLILGARRGFRDICCKILSKSFEMPKMVNAKDRKGTTALLIAAGRGYVDVVRDLLDRQDFTGVNATTRDGQTALILAARMGQREICGFVLARPDFTEVNATDKHGRTALHWAAGSSRPEILKAILARKDFNMLQAKTKDGHTALDIASRYFISDAVDILRDAARR
jgi:ankyrin repeat protein